MLVGSELVLTRCRIHNITGKSAERDLLYVQPTNPANDNYRLKV